MRITSLLIDNFQIYANNSEYMNIHTLIPLTASIVYIPLFVLLLLNRPWQREQKIFLFFLLPAFLWSLSDTFGRSDFFMPYKLLLVKVVVCLAIWTVIQFHYFLRSFYQPDPVKIPAAYAFLASTIGLALLGYIPGGIEITARGIDVDYGIWLFAIAFLMVITLGGRDIYYLVRRLRISPDLMERNVIVYVITATGILIIFTFGSFAPRGGEYPVGHIGNFIVACILIYAVVAHRLLDMRVVLRRALMYLGMYGGGFVALGLLLLLIHLVFGFSPDLTTLGVVCGIGIPIVVIFVHRVRATLQEKVEQAFAGEKYNYRRELSSFVSQIHDVTSLEQFGSHLISLLSQSVGSRRACLLLPQAEVGDFAARFAYPPVEDNPMMNLNLRRDSPVVTWLKRENTILPERNLGIFPEFQSIWQEEKEDIQAARVEMFIPVMNRGELVAIWTVTDKQDGGLYTVEDIDLLESVASRVAASMEKEYFHEQIREQSEELSLINRLTIIVTSSISVEEIFEGFISELKKAVDVDWATIALVEGDQLYFPALSSTIGSTWQSGERIPLKGTGTEWVSREKKSLYENDLARYRRFWTGEHHLKWGVRSIIYLPLIIKDESIGSLTLGNHRPNAYNPKQVRLLEQLALQIATPIENSQLYARAEQRSRIDELTGLFNRRHFEERLQEEITRHSRYGSVFSLFLLDLDNFKAYNDIYGHPSGDKLLNQIGGIIRRSIRNADQAFRYGGDEFIVILPETTMDDAYIVGDRVRGQIASEMKAEEIAVTCSVGLASYPSDGIMFGELVTVADTALYHAKRTGGNRVYLSSRILSEPLPESGTYARGSGLSAVYALASAVDAKDAYTYDHSKRVNIYAVALAEAIGLSPDEVSRVSTAALLHDIGKISISDKILRKKAKLNAEEWEQIKTHPRLGANIVGNVPNLVPCVSGILYHHERWDGTGYPEGLAGEAIPLEARILTLADAFAAMTSARPYRDALSNEEVMKELEKGAGKQFDPKLVEIFKGIVEADFSEKAEASQDLLGE
ncbi:MAG: diguanylate cyclase [Dehalococcoidia bacterium]|nr:diguanylate cyclase [Dehalococcoidia bacterium]